jgi:hypothetical protein
LAVPGQQRESDVKDAVAGDGGGGNGGEETTTVWTGNSRQELRDSAAAPALLPEKDAAGDRSSSSAAGGGAADDEEEGEKLKLGEGEFPDLAVGAAAIVEKRVTPSKKRDSEVDWRESMPLPTHSGGSEGLFDDGDRERSGSFGRGGGGDNRGRERALSYERVAPPAPEEPTVRPTILSRPKPTEASAEPSPEPSAEPAPEAESAADTDDSGSARAKTSSAVTQCQIRIGAS